MSDMPVVYIPDVIWMSSKQGGNFLIVDVSPDIFKKEPEVYGEPLPFLSLAAVEKALGEFYTAFCKNDDNYDIEGHTDSDKQHEGVLALLHQMAGEE